MKNNYVRVRLTAAERSALEAYAEMFEMTLSEYVIYATLINPPGAHDHIWNTYKAKKNRKSRGTKGE